MKLWTALLCGWTLSVNLLSAQTVDAFDPGVNDDVSAVAVQPDGSILMLGNFYLVGGLPRNGIARLNPDGSLDPTFNPGANPALDCFAVQPDGRIIVGGTFTNLTGRACTNLGRLNPDGSLDPSFGTFADKAVTCVMLQPDCKIIVGGVFTNLAGQTCNRIGRINSDGSLDTNFSASADNRVTSLAFQTDGKILVAGNFTNLNGVPVNHIGRLNSDGSFDSSFNSGVNSSVTQIIVQSNNMIIVAGAFTNLAGAPRARIGRLNNDGSIDPSFNPGANNRVLSVALQANGKMILGGSFTTLAGVARNHIGRLNSDGTLDATYNPGANTNVNSIALQADGKIVVAGTFTNLAGASRNFIGRLSNNNSATQSLNFTASSITWTRSGSSPEISNASFEWSTNGTDWTYLADGTWIPGGWQASGLAIPAQASIRASGFVWTSGNFATSASLLQQIAGVPVITLQPADIESVPKTNVTFTATIEGTPPLAYQWQFNGTNLVNSTKIFGATNTSLLLSNVTTTNMGSYALVVTNSSGSVTTRLASLKIVVPTTNDNFSNPFILFGTVYATAIQPDGKVILGGALNGGALFGVKRASFEGLEDLSFTKIGITVYATLVQADRDILVGGAFNFLGRASTNIARLHPDGTFDTNFTNMPNGTVYALAQQPDGKILVAGSFTLFGSQPRSYIGRLNVDGTLDTNFNTAVDSTIYSMALQANGQMIIGGSFTNVNGSVAKSLARLNSDGSLDSTFVAAVNNSVSCVAVQPNGKIIISGPFANLSGLFWNNYLACLNPDGSLDTTFNVAPNSVINTIALQSDGKMFLGGSFSSLSGVTSSQVGLARIKADGSRDNTFAGGVVGTVYSTGIQFDGSLLISGTFGGLFDSNASKSAGGMGRLKNTEAVSQQITYDGSTVTWVRNGPAPECSWVMFDSSFDGTNWTPLGIGIYTNKTWQITGISLPPSTMVRARGYVVCGYHNGSGWMIESRSGPPAFLMNPSGVTNTSAILNGFVTGTPPFTYQWMRDGIMISNINPLITGVQTPSLIIKTLLASWLGNYTLVASNAFGCATSSVATVSVFSPFILKQPVSITTNAGATVSFSIDPIGQAPLYFQWFNGSRPLTNGGNVYGAISPTLTLSNVVSEDTGSYSVLVTNSLGSIPSSVATLLVIDLAGSPPVIVSGSVGLDLVTNGFGFDVTGLEGQTIVVETSTNLIDWQPIFTNAIDSSPLRFHDPGAITNRIGLYRVRLQ
jgi:uncharacterized delta-60 repeat protein